MPRFIGFYRRFVGFSGSTSQAANPRPFLKAWTLLAARALWCFRMTRPLVVLIAALIAVSTMTTERHYFSFTDVLGGFAVAAAAAKVSSWMVRQSELKVTQ